MTAGRNDPVVAIDELGREIRATRTGQRYLATDLTPTRPQATSSRGLGYNILDNIIGYDDGVDTPGERAGAAIGAIASDPIGAARGAVGGIAGLLQRLTSGTGTMGDVIEATGLLNVGSLAATAPRGALRAGAGRDAPEVGVHMSDVDFSDIDLSRSADGTFWMASPDADWSNIVTTGSGYSHRFEISPNAKLATWDDIDKYSVDELEAMGFDGVRMDDGGGNISYQIWNTNVLERAPQTPAQRVAGLLSSGRADEVTDEMMAAADPQEMARLYASGATGMDLPMDEASRMARAQEMGFDTGLPLYHGTGSDFKAFDPARFGQSDHGAKGRGVYASQDPDLASSYATLVAEDGRQVYPLTYGLRNAYDGEIPMAMYDEGRSVAFTNSLRGAGFDGVMRPNQRRNGEITEAVAFDPRKIRSRFARFDPRLSHLSNLNAANASPLLGGAVLAAPQEQPDPLRNLRGLLAR
jgi:hypothetical protein